MVNPTRGKSIENKFHLQNVGSVARGSPFVQRPKTTTRIEQFVQLLMQQRLSTLTVRRNSYF